ncbi:MAG: OmpA family protein [Flavobacteriales bacterium]|jgi:outer membrane protein OmpA-like peptidoglycan-associated protein|nr:OmpA family protein [Flavobacteriales bacterium]
MKFIAYSIISIVLMTSYWAQDSTDNYTDPKFILDYDYYKSRYVETDLMYKIVDNWGNGFDSLYGTRNMRPILHGVAYRGGANNYYHKTAKRKNSNPLPNDGVNNLCKEGFSHSVYLYRKNWETAPVVDTCKCVNDSRNILQYDQFDYFDDQHIHDMLEIVYNSAKDSSIGPVYLHCWNGWHASGFISAVILKQFCGMSDLDAVAYWDLGTDGANTSPRYNKIRDRIKNFKPYSKFMLYDSLKNNICPPMPKVIDKSQLHISIEHLVIVPEAIPINTVLILDKVKFLPNKTTLSNPDGNKDLQNILKALQKSPDLKLEIGGHTDRSGNEATNKVLSKNRAKYVYDYLVRKGVSPASLVYKGYGSAKPAYTNRTKDGRAANRRIEVKVLDKKVESSDKLVDEEPVEKVDPYENKLKTSLKDLFDKKIGESLLLNYVVFEPNMYTINDTNAVQVDSLAEILKYNKTIKIEVTGYTDKSGIPEKNITLSINRAKAVYERLVEKGIDPERLFYSGCGDENPVAPNTYRWGRDLNRRIEIVLLEK